MELKLNVYKNEKDENGKRIIDKTYVANSCDLLWGPIEDVLGVLDFENLTTNEEITKMVFTVMGQIKPILKDIFWGLTDEELKRVSAKEIIPVIFGILGEAIQGILEDENIKNLVRGQMK